MSKENMRDQLEEKQASPIAGVAEEISEQDLDDKSGAGWSTAVQLTLSGKCGRLFTASYECTTNNVSCG